MSIPQLVLSIIDVAAAIFLIAVVLLQSGKSAGLSGAIAGGADTFFGKGKSGRKDRTLRILTTVLSTVFFVLIVALYCIAGN